MTINSNPLIFSIDQGTSATKCCVFATKTGRLLTQHQIPITPSYPSEGWVEQDPQLMLENVLKASREVINNLVKLNISYLDIKGIGLCNQRETTIVWDKITGKPLYNAIIWLDNRTRDVIEDILDRIPKRDINFFKNKTGLPISSYFSAFKLKWLLDNVPEVAKAAKEERLMFGTVDTWLLYKLTGSHYTDVTNASRTFLMNIHTLEWDTELCNFIGIPMHILPEIKASCDFYGNVTCAPLTGLPITGVIGDQSSSLVGHLCFKPGQTKATYGTGCFIMQNLGSGSFSSILSSLRKEIQDNLIITVAYKSKDGPPVYALEASIAIAGACLNWLRDNLKMFENIKDILVSAGLVSCSGGVYFVPAFQGLLAPYWDPNASGLMIGLSQYTNRSHIAYATLESIAFQTSDILSLIKCKSEITVDGGLVASNQLCQMIANISGVDVIRPPMAEVTMLGSAIIAGHTIGLWNLNEKSSNSIPPPQYEVPTENTYVSSISSQVSSNQQSSMFFQKNLLVFRSTFDGPTRALRLDKWRVALSRSMNWQTSKSFNEKQGWITFGAYLLTSFTLLLFCYNRGKI